MWSTLRHLKKCTLNTQCVLYSSKQQSSNLKIYYFKIDLNLSNFLGRAMLQSCRIVKAQISIYPHSENTFIINCHQITILATNEASLSPKLSIQYVCIFANRSYIVVIYKFDILMFTSVSIIKIMSRDVIATIVIVHSKEASYIKINIDFCM